MPETWETIDYDKDGVCNICKNIENKTDKIDWKAREKEFKELIAQYKGKGDYDCIVPFSGGKDSTYVLWAIVKKFGLKPLVVNFDHGFYRPKMLENIEKILKVLKCDYHRFRADWRVVKKVMVESLIRKGDFCWHCHTGVYAYPMQIAVKHKIPLIIWGEQAAEYTAYYGYDEKEENDESKFNRFINLGITAEDMVGMVNDEKITERDLRPFSYPKLKDLKAIKYRSICYGSYFYWDTKKQVKKIKDEIGWENDEVEGVPPGYGYEKIECMFTGVRDWTKYIKRGLGRTAHLAGIDIRKGRMTREEGMKLIKEYDGKRPASLDHFLKVVGLTEEEYMEIVLKHAIYPWKFDTSKEPRKGEKMSDQDGWDTTKIVEDY
jgi:N-acetyl sugar amidotransferase